MQGTVPGAGRLGRPRTAWMDDIKTWTGLSVEESIRMTEDGENGDSTSMVWPTLGSRTAKEQNKQNRRGGLDFWGNVQLRAATLRVDDAIRMLLGSFVRRLRDTNREASALSATESGVNRTRVVTFSLSPTASSAFECISG